MRIPEEAIKEGQFRGISDNNEIVGYIVNKKNNLQNAIIYKNSKINYIFSKDIESVANFISRDGKVIGGYFFDQNEYSRKPFLYINNKIIDLEKEYKKYLEEDSYLIEVYNISSNNIYVIGVGYNSETQSEQPFVVNISKFLF